MEPVTLKSRLCIFAPGTNNNHSESVSRMRNEINSLSKAFLGGYCCNNLLSYAMFRFNPGVEVPVTLTYRLFVFVPGLNNRHTSHSLVSRTQSEINVINVINFLLIFNAESEEDSDGDHFRDPKSISKEEED